MPRGRPAMPDWMKIVKQRAKEHTKELGKYQNPEHLTVFEYKNGSTYLTREYVGRKRVIKTHWVPDRKERNGIRRYKQLQKKAGASGQWLPIDQSSKQQ